MFLDKWLFTTGNEEPRMVTIPHTWNVEEGLDGHEGRIGWYEYHLTVPNDAKRRFLYFHSVYHDAVVYLNGQEIGRHENSGFTPFTIEMTDYLLPDQDNTIKVRVDDRYSQTLLPYMKSFDWPNDGGIIRPVELIETGASHITYGTITAKPVIFPERKRQDIGSAVFGAEIHLDGAAETLNWTLYRGADEEITELLSGYEAVSGETVCIPSKLLSDIRFWHFDAPELYTLKAEIIAKGEVSETKTWTIGFRDLHLEGDKVLFNGEVVRLPGIEWMPGSDSAYGMAEPKEQLEKMLQLMKDTNSVITRFHWQQDDWVYDWCDRHGLLVQEEVPFWGAEPAVPHRTQKDLVRVMLKDMIQAHAHHPSIFAWGVGNELAGQETETIQYIKEAVACAKQLDNTRLVNYVSNRVFQNPATDGTTKGDALMINDYIGTWHQGPDQYEAWDEIVRTNPGRVQIPSEYGLCEPAFAGGDPMREKIFLDKMACYRQYPSVGMTVYFCLNDYRTQMGEDGDGRFRQRVHGSTDMYGNPKPSFWTVQREYDPLNIDIRKDRIVITCKNDIPCYTVKNREIEILGQKIRIVELKPGESLVIER